MADDEREKVARRLQMLSRREWSRPHAVHLVGPGPFELALSGKASVLGRGSDPQFVLMLETAKESKTVRIPILSSELPGMKAMVDYLYAQFLSTANKPPH